MKKTIFNLIIGCFLLTNTPLSSQNFSGGFNFNLPFNDSTPQRFLPLFPAKMLGESDRVSVTGSQFTVGGKPIRFWGVNIVASAAFPDKAKAPVIAARLRKMGVNLVRFHHLENSWSGLNGTIFNYSIGTRQLQAATLDRLDFLIAELKRNGIYVNMNLNVSREFKVSDGVQGADSLPEFAKAVTLFDPYLQFLQREFAQQLLGHTNPYTGLPLATDPVLAMVEMNNENTIYGYWKDNQLRPITEGGSLIVRHNRMLDSLYQNFLIQKYTTTANLLTAWQAAGGTAAPEIFQNGGFEAGSLGSNWALEQNNASAAATFTVTNTEKNTGGFSGQLNTTAYSGTDWHLQMKQIGFSMQKDTSYELSFWVKGNNGSTFTLSFMQDVSPYNWYTGTSFTATNQWKKYTYVVSIPSDQSNLRMTISPKSTGTLWFDDFSFKKVVPKGLDPTETLANRTIQRILWSNRAQFTAQRAADNGEFYIRLHKAHSDSLRNYLRNSLNVRVGITGNNALVGAADTKAQENMDYIDDHSYWDHPQFPAGWSSTNWSINNNSQLTSARLDALTNNFSGVAMTNKPHTISEYNHGAPNRFRAEMPPLWLAYGSLHGADGVMFFDYNSDNAGWEADKVDNHFSIHRDNSVMALFPSCAWAFRQGWVKEDNNPIRVSYTEGGVFNQNQVDNVGRWTQFVPYDKRWGLLRGVKTDSYSAATNVAAPAFSAPANEVYTTATNETVFDASKDIFTTNTPNYASITGFLANNAGARAGNLNLVQANQFGAITWVSVVNAPLSNAGRSLLTISTTQQNTNMIWNATNKTVNNNWGTAPTSMQAATVRLRLTINADSIKIYPLSNTGSESRSTKFLPISANTFDITLDQNADKTLWYGIQAFGSQVITNVEEQLLPRWNSVFPNPVCTGSATLDYHLQTDGQTQIGLYNMAGQLVKTVLEAYQSVGQHQITADLNDVSNGQYQLVITQLGNVVSTNLHQSRPVGLPITVLR
jgi:Carbohydrate binding domain/Secretion system C-terminal sorting domain